MSAAGSSFGPSGSTFAAFLQIDGVPGESLDDKHKDWIEVLSVHHGMSLPISSTKSSSGGGTTGRAMHEDYVITKFVDKSSVKLFEALSNGKHFDKMKIEFCRAGGQQVKFLEVNLEEVVISNIHTAGGSQGGGGDQMPTETVSLNYGKIEWVYTQQKRKDGSGGGNVSAKFDLTAGK